MGGSICGRNGRLRRPHAWPAIVAAACLLILAGMADRPAALGEGTWTSAGNMSVPRVYAAAARLPDGRVLVAGGETGSGSVTASADIYDPATGAWTPTKPMSTPRAHFTATRLQDGRVLVVGGSDGVSYLASAELYDPIGGQWASAGRMSTARADQTATLLNDGRVLVVGGFGPFGPLASVEIYDPSSNSWSKAEDLLVARAEQAAALRKDGQVVVTGGMGARGPINSVERYDPASARWVGFTPLPGMLQARYLHTETLLPDGRILVAGGFDAQGNALASAELYNPDTDAWSPAASMSVPRGLQSATALPNGQVLVAGGRLTASAAVVFVNSAEIYDEGSNSWTPVGNMLAARYAQTATLLKNGQVLVAGGSNGVNPLSSAELYTPSQPATAKPTATSIPPTSPPPPPPPKATAMPTSPPAPTPIAGSSFRILGVRVERTGGKPDWQQTVPSLKSVTVGTRIRLSVYVSFAPVASTHLTIAAQVHLRGKIVYRAGLTEDRSGGGQVWEHWSFVPASAGTYTFTARVRANGVLKQGSSSFKAVTPQKVSFTFDRLQTLNAQGQPAHSFSRTDRVVVQAIITVRHAAGTVNVTIGQTLERPTVTGWQPLGKRVQNSFVTTNGTHPYSVSFVPQSPYSLIRVVIDVTIGSETQRKSVTFEVHS